jgi:hypothetical protein
MSSKDGHLIDTGEFPISLGLYTTIPKAPRGKAINQTLSCYLDIVHIDIMFRDCASIGGYKYALIFVDHATRYNWMFGLKSLQQEDILAAFLAFRDEAGSLSHQFCCNCVIKRFGSGVQSFLHTNKSSIASSPDGRQAENGLVKAHWKIFGAYVLHLSNREANAPIILVLCHQACCKDDERYPWEVQRETQIAIHACPWCAPRSTSLASNILSLLLPS